MAPDALTPPPEAGRRFRARRRVRLADADRSGRLRLDALARFLQDVGNEDTADAGLDPTESWVTRRTAVRVDRWPRLGEALEVVTWCSGLGRRWAERRTSVAVAEGRGSVEVASLWVRLDPSGRPAPLSDRFLTAYGEAAAGRTVSARLRHPAVPFDAEARPWAVRSSDLDVLGHVNNAATWEAVEDEVARRGVEPASAELEYRDALELDDEVVLRSTVAAATGALCLWLTVAGEVRASALVTPRG